MTITLKLMSQSRSLRLKGILLLMLTLLVVSLLLERDGSGTLSPSGKHLNVTRGPFVQQLLNSFQLDEIHHLVKRMSYKQLASLYVSRMTLDEEIGQLFMVQNSHSTYSTDLEQTTAHFQVYRVILHHCHTACAGQR